MPLSPFPQGLSTFGVPVLPGAGTPPITGDVFWVDNGDPIASDTPSNGTFEQPFDTINYASTRCTASNGDQIFVKAGHDEAVSAIAGLSLAKAGVTVWFLGEGADKAKVTFSGVAGADMDIDAASITLVNPKFVAALDALTGPIDVNAADFTIINGEYHDGTTIDTTDCIVVTSAAIRLKIHGWKYYKGNEAGTAKQSGIQLNGVDDAELFDIDIFGAFDEGNIECLTDEWLNMRMKNVTLVNTDTDPSPCIVGDANMTGVAENVKCRVASGTTYVSNVGKMSWGADCEGFSTDGYGGEPIGTAVSTGVEGKLDTITTAIGVIDEFHDVPAANNVLNAQINEVIGNKTDTATTGAVSATATLVAYIKQLVTEGIARDAAITTIDNFLDTEVAAILADTDTISGITLPSNPVANSLAAFIASGGTALGTELADSKSIVDAIGFDGSAFVAGGLGMYLPRCVEKSDGAVLTGNDNLFTITGGPVRAKIVGYVSVEIGGASNGDLQIVTTAPAATADLNAAPVAITSDAVGTAYHNVGATSVFTPTTAGAVILDPVTEEEVEFILPPGTVHFRSSGAQTGTIKWYMTYTPLSPLSVVTAAA